MQPGNAEKALGMLRAVTNMVAAADLEGGLEIACRAGASILDFDGCAALVYNPSEKSVVQVASVPAGAGLVDEKMWLRLPEGSVFMETIRSGKILPCGPLKLGGDALDLSRFSCLCLVPAMLRDEELPRGLLAFYDFAGKGREARALGPFEKEIANLLSSQVAAAIRHFDVFTTLRRSEDKYRALTENAVDLVFALDSCGRFTFVNERAKEILGREPSELIGAFWSDIVEPEWVERTLKSMEEAYRRRAFRVSYEWVVPRPGGDKALLDVSASLVWRHDEIRGQHGIARDVTERVKLQEEVSRRTQELLLSEERRRHMRDYAATVTRIQEEERKRIARELHDETIQTLVAIGRKLEAAKGLLVPGTENALRAIGELEGMVRHAAEGLRAFIKDLRPPVLDDLGLPAALGLLAADARRRGGASVVFTHSGFENGIRLDTEIESAIFRIAQEALNNALKHGEARSIEVRLSREPSFIRLVVSDDGKGFAVPPVLADLARSGRLGLVGMSERAELLGGSLQVDSRTGRGTAISLVIPLRSGKPS